MMFVCYTICTACSSVGDVVYLFTKCSEPIGSYVCAGTGGTGWAAKQAVGHNPASKRANTITYDTFTHLCSNCLQTSCTLHMPISAILQQVPYTKHDKSLGAETSNQLIFIKAEIIHTTHCTQHHVQHL